MRVTDILYAFPALLLAVLLAAAVGGSTLTGMLAIGVATIPVFVRITRAATLQVMSQDYVMAARSCGTTWPTVALRHVWPNIAPLVGVQASVSFAMAILAEAALSYLGLATTITTPSWGRMLYEAQSKQLFSHPEQVIWPGLAIALAVVALLCALLGFAVVLQVQRTAGLSGWRDTRWWGPGTRSWRGCVATWPAWSSRSR